MHIPTLLSKTTPQARNTHSHTQHLQIFLPATQRAHNTRKCPTYTHTHTHTPHPILTAQMPGSHLHTSANLPQPHLQGALPGAALLPSLELTVRTQDPTCLTPGSRTRELRQGLPSLLPGRSAQTDGWDSKPPTTCRGLQHKGRA